MLRHRSLGQPIRKAFLFAFLGSRHTGNSLMFSTAGLHRRAAQSPARPSNQRLERGGEKCRIPNDGRARWMLKVVTLLA